MIVSVTSPVVASCGWTVTLGAAGVTFNLTLVFSCEPSLYVINTGTSVSLSGLRVGNVPTDVTDWISAFWYVFVTPFSTTPVIPVAEYKSVPFNLSVGFLIMSTFVTSCGVKVCVPSLDTTLTSPSPLLAVAVTVAFTKSRGISILPLWTLTPLGCPVTCHPFWASFVTTTLPDFRGIVILSPEFVESGVTFKFPFCHWPTVGASGVASFTATYTLTWVPFLPWLSTAAKVTSYNPAGVIPVPFAAGFCEIILTFPAPNGLFSSSVALSSASVTVTNSFNKSAVNVVPES